MAKYIALLRGINLAGKNRISKESLVQVFTEAGCVNVDTYIQSGNVIFGAPVALLKKLPQIITEDLGTRFGCKVPVLLRTAQEIAQTVRDNPFPEAAASEKMLHVYFLAHLPDPLAIKNLDPSRSPPDAFYVRNREIYVLLPNGMARTKLTNAYFDSRLSTTSTARNWATVLKLHEMTRDLSELFA